MSFWKKFARKKPSNENNASASPNSQDNLGDRPNPEFSNDICGLFTLSGNNPPDHFHIDIIAVHGLSGNWRQTWTHDNGTFWLAQFLPVQFPNARVMAYGYNANVFLSKAVTDIKQEAEILLRYLADNRQGPEEKERPILFMAHSLGGILVKKTVIVAHEQTHVYGQLLDSIKGVIFFAVPHRGAQLAAMATQTARALSFFGFNVNTRHVSLLSRESDPLMDISSQFKNRANGFDITTFVETEKYKGHLIVDANSSRLELANEEICGIPESNHRTICKFDSIDSPKYEMVWKAIERLVHKYLQIQPDCDTSESFRHWKRPPFITKDVKIPASLDEGSTYTPTKYTSPHFVGREEYLRELITFFQPRCEDEVPSRREFLLYGIGGAGKTQICLKFAEQHSNMFWKVFWVDATNKDTLELSFQGIRADPSAKKEGVDGSSDSVVRWLSHVRKEWLLILDNADGDPTILDAYIPNGRRGNILITSRNPNVLHRVKANGAREIGEMEREDAKLLLGKVARLDEMTIKDMDVQLGSIVDELHSMALAIDHAGAAILSGLCDLVDYVTMLKKHRKHLLANSDFRGAPGYNQTIYSTWSLTTSLLEERAELASSANSPERAAIQLLNIFAFFHNNSIMEETFRRAAEARHADLTWDTSGKGQLPMASKFLPKHLLQTGTEGKWDSLLFREGIRVLHSFSLLRRDRGQATYSIHPLVHLWSRERLAQCEQNRTCLLIYGILSASIGFREPDHDFQYCRRVIPHLISFRQAMADSAITERYFDDSFANFWHAFSENGFMKEAEHFASELKTYRTRALGDRDQRTLHAAEYLAVTLRESGMEGTLERSNVLVEDIYRLRVETLGEDHLDTMRSKIHLGCTSHYNGNFRKAEELLYAAWHSARILLGETHSSTLTAATQLSSVYWELGNYTKAEEIQRKNLQTLRQLFGDEDPQTIGAMANLASTLTNLGKYDESEALKLRIADLRAKTLGKNHRDSIMAHANLAATYSRQKRWKEAEQIIMDVIQRRLVVLGELNRETLRARLILTTCYEGQGRLHDAEVQCKRVVEGRKVLIGDQHAHTLWSTHKLAIIYAGQGRLEEAIDLWKETVDIQQNSENIGEDHWETQEAMHHLACALHRHGQKDKAMTLMERVLELKRKRLPNEQQNPSILASEKALGDWRMEPNQG